MPGRILTLQRQARELGRLRSGYTDTSGKKPRPVRSNTWIITSHAEHYVRAAAEVWGGTPEAWQPLGNGVEQWRVITEANALDAIMPPGDPLSQSYEQWSRGGCTRRCDGMTEQLADRPCMCRAEHGDDWWTREKGTVCAATTRLNLVLPQMPDVGVWRLETHSHYAANEIAAHVDLIRSATRGEVAVPVRVRIEQRTRVANGATKQFPVVAVELRGVTAGQVLAGQVLGGDGSRPQLTAAPRLEAGGAARPALPAGTQAEATTSSGKPLLTDDEQSTVLTQIADAATVDNVRAMWRDLAAAYHLNADGPVIAALKARAAALTNGAAPAQAEGGADDDAAANAVWLQILQAVPEQWTTEQVERDFAAFAETPVEQAGAPDMRRYLAVLPQRIKAAS